MAHGKPLVWDPSDQAHTAHRIICGLLILSVMASFCFPNSPRLFFFGNPYLDGLFSVFYRPNLLLDLLHANMSVYPALLKMSRILPELKKDSLLFSSSNHDLDFVLYILLLVIIIGGGCNIVASRVTDRSCFGFNTTVAASLAYLHRISIYQNPVLCHIMGQPVTALGGYWSTLALSVMRNENWFTFLVAWLLAGLFGSGLAKYHLENMWLGDVFKFFGMT
jgi:hypothetical protein